MMLTRRHDAIERHLAHHQKDEKSDTGPYQALLEGCLRLGYHDLRDQGREWLDKVKEAYCERTSVSNRLCEASDREPLMDKRTREIFERAARKEVALQTWARLSHESVKGVTNTHVRSC